MKSLCEQYIEAVRMYHHHIDCTIHDGLETILLLFWKLRPIFSQSLDLCEGRQNWSCRRAMPPVIEPEHDLAGLYKQRCDPRAATDRQPQVDNDGNRNVGNLEIHTMED